MWDALKKTDEHPDDNTKVLALYKNVGIDKTYQDNGGSEGDRWNREHVWAKSHGGFSNNSYPGTDIHHVRAADKTVNSSRGNKDFDNGGESHHEATGCKTDTDSWEPRDGIKGDIARMMFYMAVRYEKDDSYDLQLVNNVTDSNSKGEHGVLGTLLKWHIQDPVDQFEKNRNNKIQDIQGNRNPFIDHPEFAQKIWGE